MFEHEIGTEFRTEWGNHRKIVGRIKDHLGTSWYWVVDEDGDPLTHSVDGMRQWTKIEPFFEEGDTFEINVTSPKKGEVLFVTEDRTAALVKFTHDSAVHYDSVTDWTYRQAENIKHKN
jgi:hypothetical protein